MMRVCPAHTYYLLQDRAKVIPLDLLKPSGYLSNNHQFGLEGRFRVSRAGI